MIKPQTETTPPGKILRKDGIWTTPKAKNRGQREYDTTLVGTDRSGVSDVSTGNKKAFTTFMYTECKSRNHNIGYNFHDYEAVIHTLNEFYIDHMLTTGNLVILPNNLGKLGVKKFKRAIQLKPDGTLNLAVDWGESNKLGSIVYHTNDHTDGNSFRFVWIKNGKKPSNNSSRSASITDKLADPEMWRFKTTTKARKKLVNYVKDFDNDIDKFHYMTDKKKEGFIFKRELREKNANSR